MVDRLSLAAEWLQAAEADYEMAERALGPGKPFPGMAAYHFQQTAEKMLKAFLTFHGRVFEKTHDLGRLCQWCAEIDPIFQPLIDRFDRLTDYAVDARYPGVEKPSDEDIWEARAITGEIRNLVLDRLPGLA
jgi:HEPN domain-containing protein